MSKLITPLKHTLPAPHPATDADSATNFNQTLPEKNTSLTAPRPLIPHITARELIFLSCIASLGLITRNYRGIWHDAILYTGQALYHLYPADFANDLFFRYGSQDKYSLFSGLYAFVIRLVGVDDAARLLTLLGQTLWIAGAMLFTRKLLPNPISWLATAAIVTFVGVYSGNDIFTVREPFITPRLLAEGLSLWALYSLLNKNIKISIVLLFLASILHPLNTLAALMIMYFMLLASRPKLALVIAAISLMTISALALNGIPPADALIRPIDKEWFSITFTHSPHLYISNLGIKYWNIVAITLATLTITWLRAPKTLSHISRAALLTSVVGIALSWWASESLASLLIIQLQTWRVLWLGMVVAMAGATWIAWQTVTRQVDPVLLIGLIASCLYFDSDGWIAACAVTFYAILPSNFTARSKRLSMALAIGVLIIGGLEYILLKYTFLANTIPLQLRIAPSSLTPLLVSVATIICFLFAIRWPKSFTTATLILALSLGALTLGALSWDKQPYFSLLSSHDKAQIDELQELIPNNESVYWGNSPQLAWLLLHRPSYYSPAQTAGAIFNRGTAIEADRRSKIVAGLAYSNQEKIKYSSDNGNVMTRSITEEDIANMCTDPALNWLVLNTNIPGWKTVYSRNNGAYYFYRCKDYLWASTDRKTL